jgi:hypothetical protein
MLPPSPLPLPAAPVRRRRADADATATLTTTMRRPTDLPVYNRLGSAVGGGKKKEGGFMMAGPGMAHIAAHRHRMPLTGRPE